MTTNPIVAVDQLPDGIRLVLPRRELPRSLVRVSRSVTILGGAAAAVGLARLATVDFSILSAGSLLSVAIGLVGIFFGLLVWCGHSVIICGDGKLQLREACGPLRWQRTFNLTELSQLTISTLPLAAGAKSASSTMAGESITILAGEVHGRGRRVLMFGYAPDILNSVLAKLPIRRG